MGSDKKTEQFYHGFVLALIASVNSTHHIRSNRESGLGRFDVLIFPKDASQDLAIMLEFKHAKKIEDSDKLADEALKQINEKLYATELESYHYIKQVLKVGLAFSEKSVAYSYETTHLVSHEIKPGVKRKISIDVDERPEKKHQVTQASASSSHASVLQSVGSSSSSTVPAGIPSTAMRSVKKAFQLKL